MNSQDDEYAFRSISEVQKVVLAILPISSAVLSICGSSIIIYMAMESRNAKAWTPYNRLLVGMSTYDVISSCTLGIAAFLNPKETSEKAFAFGNDASCSAIGFLNQISYSGILYNGMLSFYFLLTARFAMKNERIARKFEPMMHMLSIGFPTACAFVGLVLGVYSEPEVGIGCWVNRYPKRCGYGPDGTGEVCLSATIAWVFGGWIGFFTLFALIINNIVIWYFARKHTSSRSHGTKSKRSATEADESLYGDDDGRSSTGRRQSMDLSVSSIASSFRTFLARPSSHATISMDQSVRANQKRRLKLVSSQAFLFVASFVVCNLATYLLKLFESQSATYVQEKELPYTYYMLLVLQAVLFPLQGLFNMFVYVRPKYLRCRTGYSRETRLWAVRRAIFGSKIEPLHSLNGVSIVEDQAHAKGNGARDFVSSLTRGSGHEDENEGEMDLNSREYSRKENWASHISRSSKDLEIISEFSREDESASFRPTRQIDDVIKSEDNAVPPRSPRIDLERESSNPRMVKMDGSVVSVTEDGLEEEGDVDES